MKQVHKVIVKNKKGHVLVIGHNNYNKNNPLQYKLARRGGLSFLYAEIVAIIKVYKKTNLTLYIN